MTDLQKEVATIIQHVNAIEKFKTESFCKTVKTSCGEFKEKSIWILENKPDEVFMCEKENEVGYLYIFYCKNKQLLNAFVDKFQSLFHY